MRSPSPENAQPERRHRRGGQPPAVAAKVDDPRVHSAVIPAHALLKIRPRLRAEAVAVDVAHAARDRDGRIRLRDERARNGIIRLRAVRVADGDGHARPRFAEELGAVLRAARRAGLALNGDDNVARGKARLLRAAALEDGDDADALGHIGDLRADAGEAHITLDALQKRLIPPPSCSTCSRP